MKSSVSLDMEVAALLLCLSFGSYLWFVRRTVAEPPIGDLEKKAQKETPWRDIFLGICVVLKGLGGLGCMSVLLFSGFDGVCVSSSSRACWRCKQLCFAQKSTGPLAL